MFKKNVGPTERLLRIVVGLALLAFAFFGVPATEYNWLGWFGIIPLVTGLLSYCPLYTILGVKGCCGGNCGCAEKK